MNEGMESIGAAVTGGLIARAIEPGADGTAPHGKQGESGCRNCGTALIGNYCHVCGQAGHIHRTLTAWWHDLAHGVLHLDGKIWRTLPLLVWRPGELTRRYVEGERARFVSPIALFLFSVFLTFAVFSLLGGPLDIGSTPEQERAEARQEFRDERAESLADLAELERELAAARAAGEDVAALQESIEDERGEMAAQDFAFRLAMRLAGEEEAREAAEARDGVDPEGDDKPIGLGQTGWPSLDAAIKKANDNPSLLFYKLQNNAYKFSWALIPLSVPFVWLLFLHRRRYRQYRAYDHTVFVTYSIAFMSLGMIVLGLLSLTGIGGGYIMLALAVVPPLHMYRQLRGAYRLSRFSAAWRTIMLTIFALLASSLFFMLLLAIGVLA